MDRYLPLSDSHAIVVHLLLGELVVLVEGLPPRITILDNFFFVLTDIDQNKKQCCQVLLYGSPAIFYDNSYLNNFERIKCLSLRDA
jgi:hypothetical protein